MTAQFDNDDILDILHQNLHALAKLNRLMSENPKLKKEEKQIRRKYDRAITSVKKLIVAATNVTKNLNYHITINEACEQLDATLGKILDNAVVEIWRKVWESIQSDTTKDETGGMLNS